MSRRLLVCAGLFLLVAVVGVGVGRAAEAPSRGGTLRYAMIDTPPTLDQHVVTATLGTTISQHFFETLFTFNEAFEPVPFLAKGAEVRDGGRVLAIQLRQGVPFHNGKEMTSADVVASLIRWGQSGARGPVFFKHVEQVEADGKYGVRIRLKEPFAPWATLLGYANGGPVIYPKEVAEAATKQPIPPKDYIGTGPYRFVEWKAGHEIILERFDKYVGRSEKGDGYAGERVAYFDRIVFVPVPDPGTRVSGVKAGEYDYAENIPGDLFEGLEHDPGVRTRIRKAATFGLLFFNQKEGLMTNPTLRQAMLAALDMEPVMRAAVGPEKLWAMNGALMPPDTQWYTKIALDRFSQKNPGKARALAKEAGYKGEVIRFMCTTSYADHYSASVVLVKQLKDAGFNIDLQIYDWATLVSRRAQPNLWDVFYTTHGFVPDPMLYTYMSPTYPGWWDSPAKRQYANEFTSRQEHAKRLEAVEKLQALVYEEVPVARTGDMFVYDIFSPRLQGIGSTTILNFNKFWNVWLRK
jgi:peptide/nickel transport system substrate-binding protein